MIAKRNISVEVNGALRQAEVEPRLTLADFQRHHALQCGFCTPGMLTTLTELLNDNPDPTEDEVREVITGNLCRCTGYAGIVAAALDAARRLREGEA